jgi:starch synthase
MHSPSSALHVVMVATENAALKGGKVGGMADVIQGLSKELAALGVNVTTIVPSYGTLHLANPSSHHATVAFPFWGKKQTGEFWKLDSPNSSGATHLMFEHPIIRGAPIYFDDPPDAPFMRDATKYALFSSAVGQYLKSLPGPFILHLHDWHPATILLLAELHPEFSELREIDTVFTIHNLAIQGTRPMSGHESSLQSWFPELFHNPGWVSIMKDSRYADPCYTPMAIGIRFSDKINTVSPSYAQEILLPTFPSTGLVRGEGMEEYLQNAAAGNRLFGILNGIEYPTRPPCEKKSFSSLCSSMIEEVQRWNDAEPSGQYDQTLARLEDFRNDSPAMVLSSVARVVDQKVRLYFERGSAGMPAIEGIFRAMAEYEAVFIMLGSGDAYYDRAFEHYSKAFRRFIFINRYSGAIANDLYRSGDLFIMPSLFEPCGISQMLAMRESQPCLVHRVGGLKDTVQDMQNGFAFDGESLPAIADNFVGSLRRAMDLYCTDKPAWQKISECAARSRFTWHKSAKEYLEEMYK